MAKKWRLQNWLILAALGLGLIPLAVLGRFAFVHATTKPLHPTAQDVPSVVQSSPAPEWADAVARARQITRDGVAAQNLPGVSVAVGVNGTLVWAEGFGWADLDARVPVAPDTRFRIGTASIALTSSAAGLLIERGRLRLDDEIQVHVPQYPKKPYPVTVRQLMAHTAGVRADGGDEGPLFEPQCTRAAEALPHFADAELRFEPGTQYRFSTYGWILVSAAIEAVAGESLFRFLRDEVLEPLGMRDTRVEAPGAPTPGTSLSYFPRFAADPSYGPDLMRPLSLSCFSGAGAFVSTPADLVRFGMAVTGGTLLQPATLQVLQTSPRLPTGDETPYGLGWRIERATIAGADTRVVGHDGDILGGTAVSLLTMPERRLVVALTSNISYADTHGLGLKIAEAFAATTKR